MACHTFILVNPTKIIPKILYERGKILQKIIFKHNSGAGIQHFECTARTYTAHAPYYHNSRQARSDLGGEGSSHEQNLKDDSH